MNIMELREKLLAYPGDTEVILGAKSMSEGLGETTVPINIKDVIEFETSCMILADNGEAPEVPEESAASVE